MATTESQEEHHLTPKQAVTIGKAMALIARELGLLTVDVIDAMKQEDCLTESQYSLLWDTVQNNHHKWDLEG